MYLIRLGQHRWPVWMHRGADLAKCPAIRTNVDYWARLQKRMADFKDKMELRKTIDGRVKLFNEP